MGLFSSFKSKSVANVAGPQTNGSGPAGRYGSSEQQVVGGAPSSTNLSRAASPQRYQHRPLRKGEIRLFTLHRGRPDDPIRITIGPVPVGQRTPYTALSFVWGNSADTVNISADGRSLRVTKTLLVALRGVRLVDQDRLMWADQICINQLDQEEKTQQVKHMCVIYPQAKIVLCWLGEDDGTVEQAFNVLRKWAAARGEGRAKEKLRSEVATETMRQVSQGRGAQTALARLFSRPWWRRAWTLQEVCPSETNRPILVCGQHQLSWIDFYHACYTMFCTLDMSERGQAFSSAVLYVLPMLQTSWAYVDTLRLSNLVPTMARREATDPRDKIFALLGMASRAGLAYPAADYTLSADQVCVKYTRAIMEVDQSLDILAAVSQNKPNEQLPTWAIKLDRMTSESFHMDWTSKGEQAGTRHFNATLGQPVILDRPESDFDRVLCLYGTPIDTIERLYPIENFLDVLTSGQQTWSAMLDRMANLCRAQGFADRYSANGGSSVTALLETLTLDDFYVIATNPRSPRRHDWDALYASYQRFLSARASEKGRLGARVAAVSQKQLETYALELCSSKYGQETSGKALPSRKHGDTIAWLDHKCATDLLKVIGEKRAGRRMFVTSKGYIGMGSQIARAGDQVCLLFGNSTPLMLRPVRRKSNAVYELVEGAYCQGFMMGEGLRTFVRNGELRAPRNGWTRYALV